MESDLRGRNRELVRIGILGQRGDGIATLRQAMLQRGRRATRAVPRGEHARRLVESKVVGPHLLPTEVPGSPAVFATARRLYNAIEWSVDPEYGIAASDAALMDGAVLVVSAVHGPRAGTRQDILRARQAGIGHIVVFISMTDGVDDIDLPHLVELETRAMLNRLGYDGDAAPFVHGSALQALHEPGNDTAGSAIDDLFDALDRSIPAPTPIDARPLLMTVQSSSAVHRDGAQVTGRIERGRVRVGQIIEIVGLADETRQSEVLAIACEGHAADCASSGEDVSLLLSDVPATEIFRGHVIAGPASTLPRTRFCAQIRLLETADGGRSAPLPERYTPQFYFRNGAIGGEILFDRGAAVLKPGETAILDVELSTVAALQIGQRFVVREGGRSVGIGFVVKFLD